MRREPKRRKLVARCEALEPRALLAAGVAATTTTGLPSTVDVVDAIRAMMVDPQGPGSPRPASARPLLIAVVDSGVDLNTSDPIHVLGDSKYLDLADAYNAVDGTVGPSAVTDPSPNKQGTRVVSYVLQGVADSVAAGGSSNVQVVPIRAYNAPAGDIPFYALAGGILHAADLGASVINVSFAAGPNDLDAGELQQLEQAIEYARSKNAIVVVPAGDGYGAPPPKGSTPVGVDLDRPGSGRALFPAEAHDSNMLVVAATDASGVLGSVSNWGATHVDLGAPVPYADRTTAFATGYASGVAGVVAATRTDWDAIAVVDRIKATARPSASLAGRVTTGGMISPTLALNGIASAFAPATPDDYEGDLRADFAIYGVIPGTAGSGFAVASSTQGFNPAAATLINNGGASLGGAGSIPVPGDYYIGGVTDPAVYGPEVDPATGKPNGKDDFAILSPDSYGQDYVTTFVPAVGGPGDIPVVGDFDGDGRSDLALYGDHGGHYNFLVLTAASNFDPTKMLTLDNNGQGFGGPGAVPVVGDFFGDGKLDPAVYGPQYDAQGRPTGKYTFAALDPSGTPGQSSRGLLVAGIGQAGDIPIVGDYSGDGISDLALYGNHGGAYNFQVLSSSNRFDPAHPLTLDNGGRSFGGPGAVPISGDFFGDGGTDLAVYGPEYGTDGRPDGLDQLAAIDLKPAKVAGQPVKSLFIPGFGGPTGIPASAPPIVRWREAQS